MNHQNCELITTECDETVSRIDTNVDSRAFSLQAFYGNCITSFPSVYSLIGFSTTLTIQMAARLFPPLFLHILAENEPHRVNRCLMKWLSPEASPHEHRCPTSQSTGRISSWFAIIDCPRAGLRDHQLLGRRTLHNRTLSIPISFKWKMKTFWLYCIMESENAIPAWNLDGGVLTETGDRWSDSKAFSILDRDPGPSEWLAGYPSSLRCRAEFLCVSIAVACR